jgi:ribosomal protein S12 methylthiotransferase accessory factor YcaO
MQLEDGNEVVVCVLSITSAGETVPFYFPPNFVMDGLSLGTLSSGKVYLYF